jgi:cytochrome c-type biogenesis protein CcmH
MSVRGFVVLAVVLATAVPAVAIADGRPNAADLESELVCPTCKTTLDQSDSPVAQRMKAFVRARIAAGDSEQQIKDALVDQFGEGVLARPPRGGFGALAWALPLAALGAGAVAVALLVRAWSRRRVVEADDEAPLDPRLERLVDEELARFDG